MKRASYREAIEWIALNDNPGDPESIEITAGYLSVGVISAIFDVPQMQKYRDKQAKQAARIVPT